MLFTWVISIVLMFQAGPSPLTPNASPGLGPIALPNGIATLDFQAGTGMVTVMSYNGPSLMVTTGLNTAVTPTLAAVQAGKMYGCVSSSGLAVANTCAMVPTLTAYTSGMILSWTPDVTSLGGPVTLDIDFLGVTPIKLVDGITDPGAGDFVAGRTQQIQYSGTVFRLLNATTLPGVLGESQPACTAGTRGRQWFILGATGVQDSMAVCGKNASDAYVWFSIPLTPLLTGPQN